MSNRAATIYISWVISLLYLFLLSTVFLLDDKGEKRQVDSRKAKSVAIIDSCETLIIEGDIMLRSGNDFISTALAELNVRDKTYSHCGIVLKGANGELLVAHSIGGEDNPDQQLIIEPIKSWLNPDNIDGFGVVRYDMDSEQVSNLKLIIAEQYAQPVRFDMDFDLETDDRLYCSEFVSKALLHVLKDSLVYHIDTLYSKPIIGVDNLFLNSKARFICKVRF